MPEYLFGDQTVGRKNFCMACVIGPKFEEADDA
jgi:hypothetical protein